MRQDSARWDFRMFWAGQVVSKLGSGIGSAALPLTAILVLHASPAQMGIVAAIATAPVLVIGLPAGIWVDRLRRKPLLIAADCARAAILMTVPLAALTGHLSLVQLYCVTALSGALVVCFDLASTAYLPSLVAREDLVGGNSALSAGDSIAEIGGSALGGILVQAITAPLAVAVDGFSFLVSACSLALIRREEQPPPRSPTPLGWWGEVSAGLMLVVQDPTLRALAISSAIFTFFGNFFNALYALYAVRVLGLSPALLGIIIATGGIGALAGAVVVSQAIRRIGMARSVGVGLALAGMAQIAVPLAGGPPAAAASILIAAQLLGDVAIAVYLISELSLRQTLIPDGMLGRANAGLAFLSGSVGPIAALTGGALGELVGPRITLGIAAMGIIIASGPILISAR